jgi:hypothetical protein
VSRPGRLDTSRVTDPRADISATNPPSAAARVRQRPPEQPLAIPPHECIGHYQDHSPQGFVRDLLTVVRQRAQIGRVTCRARQIPSDYAACLRISLISPPRSAGGGPCGRSQCGS